MSKFSGLLLCCCAIAGLLRTVAADFLAGGDMSHLGFFEERGVVYRDEGQPRDALAILKSRGLNCVRLRLFTSSPVQAQANPYNYVNNLDYTLPLAIRVKKAGLSFLLDFHYSDTWADPGKQAKPAAWTNLSFLELEQQLYEYNSNTIAAFRLAGAMPEYVQVGNEIIGGMLWPDGRVGGSYDNAVQWSQLGRLLKAAIRGVQDGAGAGSPKIMIHIDRGGDWGATQWFFDKLLQQGITLDVIGQSYYPFWHGTFDALGTCLTNTVARYGKPVIVAETAFPWTNSAPIQGIQANTNGQVEFVVRLAKIVKGLPGGKGLGVFWWGTEYQRISGAGLAGFDSRSFFDRDGNTLPVARALGQLTAPVRMGARPANGGGVILTWPLSGAGMSLVTTTNVADQGAWKRAANSVENNGPEFISLIPAEANYGFFRLAD